jgi:hypothetical protein
VNLCCRKGSQDTYNRHRDVTQRVYRENFSNLGKDVAIHLQEVFRTLNIHEYKRHCRLRIIQNKEQRKNTENYNGEVPSYLQKQIYQNNSRFLTQTLKSRRAWTDVFQALNQNNFQSRLLCPENASVAQVHHIFFIHSSVYSFISQN